MTERSCFMSVLLVALWSAVGLAADTSRYPAAELLMEPGELAEPAVAKQFVILDVRPAEAYQQGHVAGAQRVDHDDWKAAFGAGDGRDAWSQRIGQLGISADSKVVIYDDNAMKDAARIWWILRYWGLEDVCLLNGGWQGWISAGLPTTDEAPPPASEVPFQARPQSNRLVTMGQILPQLGDGQLQIVDARSEEEFCGVQMRDNLKGGAIPGAKHLDWSHLVDQQTHRFKSPGELQRLFSQANIDLDRPTASHCQSGGRASVMAFTLELMGARDARNYFKGWSEWGNSEDAPVVVTESAE